MIDHTSKILDDLLDFAFLFFSHFEVNFVDVLVDVSKHQIQL